MLLQLCQSHLSALLWSCLPYNLGGGGVTFGKQQKAGSNSLFCQRSQGL